MHFPTRTELASVPGLCVSIHWLDPAASLNFTVKYMTLQGYRRVDRVALHTYLYEFSSVIDSTR